MISNQIEAYKKLKSIRRFMPRNTVKTIAGQIKSGNVDAAFKGMKSVMEKRRKHRGE